MNMIFFILVVALNWAIKLIMGWAAWHFTHWAFTDPAEWVAIVIVSVAAVTTKINISWTDDRGRNWSTG
ncbi:hypothetical protein HYO98_gp10 [Dinoroseobacter phage DS-1410Ws-06]|uniref:Uncharacterized protein n=1 Tax=Dinoroseobacter phage DS-1410Ws-06 TaxID=1815983 RepID=A0A191VY76_9CAUD|nr:hypothetical protein HYO98_gp10 [Dinoroseobacter phage DS-1410Ws-06]ANJ20667.1 hypothetical protein DSp06_gp10 [Dinoroseobacter phage DS-1410Ws-06]